MYYTMSLTPNSAGLFLDVERDIISVRHKSGDIIAQWMLDTLAQQFLEKMPALVFVVAHSVKKSGKVFYLVGNRTVKGIQLPTDQFIAETFERYGFTHITTIQRYISNKTMPRKNSPTNIKGATIHTMLHEYIVVCEKSKYNI